ncbi:hypothetical protein Ciccas_003444, partial [Cichlidogyrus casuarinus]
MRERTFLLSCVDRRLLARANSRRHHRLSRRSTTLPTTAAHTDSVFRIVWNLPTLQPTTAVHTDSVFCIVVMAKAQLSTR